MARACSDDLRKKLLKAYIAGQGMLRELAVRFDVSVAWVWKVSSAHKKTGSMERPPQVRHGRRSRVGVEPVKQLLDGRPDLTLRGLKEALAEAGTLVSQSHLWRVVRALGYRLKKKSIHAAERDTEANRQRRVEFLERLAEIAPERLIFLDKTGVTTSMRDFMPAVAEADASPKPPPADTGRR